MFKKLLYGLFISCGQTPKDGATNIAAGMLGFASLTGYLVDKGALDPQIASVPAGAIVLIAGGITSWCVGKDDNLGLR